MQISEFEASLVYRVSSRTARTTQRNPVSEKIKNQKPTNQTKQKQKQNKTTTITTTTTTTTIFKFLKKEIKEDLRRWKDLP
jgi:dephospho-CoA kinase